MADPLLRLTLHVDRCIVCAFGSQACGKCKARRLRLLEDVLPQILKRLKEAEADRDEYQRALRASLAPKTMEAPF